jgi:probable HAF family extracellular repeat protein
LVIVGGSGGTNPVAWLWTTAGGELDLGPGSAQSVSEDGSVVVGQDDGGPRRGREAFRWTAAGGVVSLGLLPGLTPQSVANGVSADGSVVVGESGSRASDVHAFRWTAAGGLQDLGPGSALGVSADGSVAVGFRASTAMMWDATNGARSVRDVLIAAGADLSDWSLTDAFGISADGRAIVGTAVGSGRSFRSSCLC